MIAVQTLNAPVNRPRAKAPTRTRPALLSLRRVSATQWRVASRDGRLGGVFRSHEAALHYAREEAIALPRAVLVIFGDANRVVSETYEAHARVRVSAVRAVRARAA